MTQRENIDSILWVESFITSLENIVCRRKRQQLGFSIIYLHEGKINAVKLVTVRVKKKIE